MTLLESKTNNASLYFWPMLFKRVWPDQVALQPQKLKKMQLDTDIEPNFKICTHGIHRHSEIWIISGYNTFWDMNFFSSLIFGQVQADGWKAMHMSPQCVWAHSAYAQVGSKMIVSVCWKMTLSFATSKIEFIFEKRCPVDQWPLVVPTYLLYCIKGKWYRLQLHGLLINAPV